MTTEILMKSLFAAIMSLVFAAVVHLRYGTEQRRESSADDRQRYLPYISGAILPLCMIVMVVLALVFDGIHGAAQMTLSICFGIFLHISLYYAVLILMLPFLRRYISARACAMLWMIPNYLYLTQQGSMEIPMPYLVIRAPERLIWSLFFVWLAGFFSVLIWNTASHLLFRFHILKDAEAVTDQTVLDLWNHEIDRAKIKKADRFRLVTSPNAATPLTIGLFRRTTQVILPARNYTADQLTLIFRHEIIHIGREDVWAKFFLVFCTAMCWFNPLMWIAMRKSADDLELSCDETVLLNSDDNTRRRYANLILDTAGDGRGFTTCLSASASAMRYRLKNIVKPRKRRSGAFTVGFTFFLLCMSCGYVALAYGSGTGSEIVYQSEDTGLYTLKYITRADDLDHTAYECVDEEAFHNYISGLTLENLTGNYSFTGSSRKFIFTYQTPDGILGIVLSDHVLKLAPLWNDSPAAYFYIPEGVDWKYFHTLIVPLKTGGQQAARLPSFPSYIQACIQSGASRGCCHKLQDRLCLCSIAM